jgi:uncharacterized protein YdhG (YjbR/CyaY superfamily)
MRTQFESIDEYIGAFPDHIRSILEGMRRTIHEAAPDAIEAIAYQMPTFRLKGKNLVHFAAFKNHIGFYPTSSGISAFRGEFAPYVMGKGTVQFALGEPIPHDLVRRIVVFRVDEVSAGRR